MNYSLLVKYNNRFYIKITYIVILLFTQSCYKYPVKVMKPNKNNGKTNKQIKIPPVNQETIIPDTKNNNQENNKPNEQFIKEECRENLSNDKPKNKPKENDIKKLDIVADNIFQENISTIDRLIKSNNIYELEQQIKAGKINLNIKSKDNKSILFHIISTKGYNENIILTVYDIMEKNGANVTEMINTPYEKFGSTTPLDVANLFRFKKLKKLFSDKINPKNQ